MGLVDRRFDGHLLGIHLHDLEQWYIILRTDGNSQNFHILAHTEAFQAQHGNIRPKTMRAPVQAEINIKIEPWPNKA
jgi:hypothetical protein